MAEKQIKYKNAILTVIAFCLLISFTSLLSFSIIENIDSVKKSESFYKLQEKSDNNFIKKIQEESFENCNLFLEQQSIILKNNPLNKKAYYFYIFTKNQNISFEINCPPPEVIS
jgi:hypothetical protein